MRITKEHNFPFVLRMQSLIFMQPVGFQFCTPKVILLLDLVVEIPYAIQQNVESPISLHTSRQSESWIGHSFRSLQTLLPIFFEHPNSLEFLLNPFQLFLHKVFPFDFSVFICNAIRNELKCSHKFESLTHLSIVILKTENNVGLC